jgi:hypothetical protein
MPARKMNKAPPTCTTANPKADLKYHISKKPKYARSYEKWYRIIPTTAIPRRASISQSLPCMTESYQSRLADTFSHARLLKDARLLKGGLLGTSYPRNPRRNSIPYSYNLSLYLTSGNPVSNRSTYELRSTNHLFRNRVASCPRAGRRTSLLRIRRIEATRPF